MIIIHQTTASDDLTQRRPEIIRGQWQTGETAGRYVSAARFDGEVLWMTRLAFTTRAHVCIQRFMSEQLLDECVEHIMMSAIQLSRNFHFMVRMIFK